MLTQKQKETIAEVTARWGEFYKALIAELRANGHKVETYHNEKDYNMMAKEFGSVSRIDDMPFRIESKVERSGNYSVTPTGFSRWSFTIGYEKSSPSYKEPKSGYDVKLAAKRIMEKLAETKAKEENRTRALIAKKKLDEQKTELYKKALEAVGLEDSHGFGYNDYKSPARTEIKKATGERVRVSINVTAEELKAILDIIK